jgi:4-hydroxy-tetrahydrodipicolinate synthase
MKTKLTREEIKAALTGPSGSVRTPFNRDGSIDYRGLATVIDHNIQNGSRTVLLTAGDSHYIILTDREIEDITKFAVRQTAGRAMVVAADRYYDTGRAVEFARFAREAGADLYMALPPDWGHSVTPETLAEHYTAVAKHIPVMMVTNIFTPRGVAFGMRAVKHCLERVKGIVAVKDDFCGEFGRRMTLLVHEQWAVFSGGLKSNYLDIWPYGGHGYLSTLITFRPQVTHEFWSTLQARDIDRARELLQKYEVPWVDFILASQGGFDAAIHGMLEIYGLAKRWRRKPYYSLSDQEMTKLRACLKENSLL